MTKRQAEGERIRYSNLQGKLLIHRKKKTKVQVTELCVGKYSPEESYYVYCKLKGATGEESLPLDQVLKNYMA